MKCEYKKVKPKKPIQVERCGVINYHIDATGFCFAQHHAEFDNENRHISQQPKDNICPKPSLPCGGKLGIGKCIWCLAGVMPCIGQTIIYVANCYAKMFGTFIKG